MSGSPRCGRRSARRLTGRMLWRGLHGSGHSRFTWPAGKTNSPQDFSSLLGDLEERVLEPLPDQTWVYPGHGDDTTLGKERPPLPELRARGW